MDADEKEYRLWRRPALGPEFVIAEDGNNSVERLGEWGATNLTFKGHSQPEAQRKAEKFWQDSGLGPGLIACLPEGVLPQ